MRADAGKMVIALIAALSLLITGCLGTFQTARVVPIRVGAFCLTSIEKGSDDNSFLLPGIVVEGGWPAGFRRFGVGLCIKAIVGIEDGGDVDFYGEWSVKLQAPENPVVDVALALEVWGIYPGELKLFLSRRFGIFEPYTCFAVGNFIESDDDDDDSNDIFGDGIFTCTLGTMLQLGGGSSWFVAGEIEGGTLWDTPIVGFALMKAF